MNRPGLQRQNALKLPSISIQPATPQSNSPVSALGGTLTTTTFASAPINPTPVPFVSAPSFSSPLTITQPPATAQPPPTTTPAPAPFGGFSLGTKPTSTLPSLSPFNAPQPTTTAATPNFSLGLFGSSTPAPALFKTPTSQPQLLQGGATITPYGEQKWITDLLASAKKAPPTETPAPSATSKNSTDSPANQKTCRSEGSTPVLYRKPMVGTSPTAMAMRLRLFDGTPQSGQPRGVRRNSHPYLRLDLRRVGKDNTS